MERSHPAGASGPSPAQHRLIVKFVTADRVAERAQQLAARLPGGRLVRASRRGRAVIAVSEDAELEALAASVTEEADVEYAEPDVVDRAV